jgi:hypothetical protein
MSRGFISALAGLAITIYAWFSGSVWPAWPSIFVFDTFDHGGFAELSHTGQAVVTILLIALNVAVWAGVVRVGLAVASFTSRRRATRSEEPSRSA